MAVTTVNPYAAVVALRRFAVRLLWLCAHRHTGRSIRDKYRQRAVWQSVCGGGQRQHGGAKPRKGFYNSRLREQSPLTLIRAGLC